MTGLILIALAALSAPQTMPHPSTAAAYQAPVIRPFEPGPDFGRELVQGDAAAERHRRPLEAPVTVEAYVRSYEFMPTDAEAAYEQGVVAAEIRADQFAGPLEGVWRIVDAAGRTRFDLVLHDPGAGPAEGGWRNGSGWGAATSDGATLTLDGAGVLTLERTGAGWRGVLTVAGEARPVSLVRPY
jgi:hypothetical protein